LEHFAHHESHGQLRIATNCITEPHNDNSYVSILGTGCQRNTLKLELEGQDDPKDWMCAIDFVDEVLTSKSDGPTFLMYAGSKLCALDAPVYKPMNHIVDWDREQNREPGTERINATYFVRRYDERRPEADHDISSTEIQFQLWNRIIMQEEMQHRPPRPPPTPEDLAWLVADVPQISAEDEFLESGLMDWSFDGVPIGCEKIDDPTFLSRVGAYFVKPFSILGSVF